MNRQPNTVIAMHDAISANLTQPTKVAEFAIISNGFRSAEFARFVTAEHHQNQENSRA